MSRSAWKLILRKGWPFFLPILLAGLPPWTAKGYALADMLNANAYILTHSVKHEFQILYLVFKIVPILLLLALLLLGNTAAKAYAAAAAGTYGLIGFLQGITRGGPYGFGICLAHAALSLLVAAAWMGEARSPKNDYARRARPLWEYWVVLPALMAFWEPVNAATGAPDFNPAYLLTSGAGLAFCMITPFYLAALILCRPRHNADILALTSVIGAGYAVENLVLVFVLNWGYAPWIGIMHLPLLLLSAYGFLLAVLDVRRSLTTPPSPPPPCSSPICGEKIFFHSHSFSANGGGWEGEDKVRP
jgi:hypothetical protein